MYASTTTKETMAELTGFQRDLMFAIASVEPAKGSRIKEVAEEYYEKEVTHGRLYPNLDTLVESGFATKDQRDRRTNEYSLTESGEELLAQRREWENAKHEVSA